MNQLKKTLFNELPFLAAVPAMVWQLLFFGIPLLIILCASFIHNNGFTFNNYIALFDFSYVKIIARSLFLALSNALICLLCAYPVAYFLAAHVKRFKNMLLFLLVLPFWTNFLVQVYAWFFLLEKNGLINALLLKIGIINTPLDISNSLFAVFIVMMYCYMPFMILPIYSTIEKLNLQLLEASADLGATPWQTFLRITLPLSMPGIKNGILLVLIPSFGEFVIPSLFGGGKHLMVGSLISYYFLVVNNSAIGAAFTLLSGLVLLGVILFLYTYIYAHFDYSTESESE